MSALDIHFQRPCNRMQLLLNLKFNEGWIVNVKALVLEGRSATSTHKAELKIWASLAVLGSHEAFDQVYF